MKKLHIIFSIITLSLVSCNNDTSTNTNINVYNSNDYEIIIIDSCEYIEYEHGSLDSYVYSLTHKGNCKFCKERSNK